LSKGFPLVNTDLDMFCSNIKIFNEMMTTKNLNMKVLPCLRDKSFSLIINSEEIFYILFEKPKESFKFSTECNIIQVNDSLCHYKAKDFIKDTIEAIKYYYDSKDKHAIKITFAQDAYYSGKINESQRELLTIPVMNFLSPQQLNGEQTFKMPQNVKDKQTMIDLGTYLIGMYKGFPKESKVSTFSGDDTIDALRYTFKNSTDVFINLNSDQAGNFKDKTEIDPYFGITKEFITAFKSFKENNVNTSKGLIEINTLLRSSFFDFIYRLVMFDPADKELFQTFDQLLEHPFVKQVIGPNKIKSG
jgi:hypothetical protein